jgi:lipopolysaccharide export system protein LptC
VPAGLALVLIAVVIANYMPPLGGFRLPGELGKLVIKGTKITMEQPRLTGFTNDSRAYEFTARAAAQDITKPDLMELHQLYAKMELQDKNTVEMSAQVGLYDIKAEILRLSDQILLTSSTGYEGRLSEAVIDVHKGTVVSEKPVAVKMLNGLLNANRLEVTDNGEVIRFDGGVTMMLVLGGGNEKAHSRDD